MKRRNNWLTNAMFSKLPDISQVVKEKFGDDNDDGRGHWEEIELMRRLFSYGDVTDKGFSPKITYVKYEERKFKLQNFYISNICVAIRL